MATATLTPVQTAMWNMVNNLSLDDKKWLSDKLSVEISSETHRRADEYARKVMELCGAWNDDPRTTEEIKADIVGNRQSGVTRQTLSL